MKEKEKEYPNRALELVISVFDIFIDGDDDRTTLQVKKRVRWNEIAIAEKRNADFEGAPIVVRKDFGAIDINVLRAIFHPLWVKDS